MYICTSTIIDTHIYIYIYIHMYECLISGQHMSNQLAKLKSGGLQATLQYHPVIKHCDASTNKCCLEDHIMCDSTQKTHLQ